MKKLKKVLIGVVATVVVICGTVFCIIKNPLVIDKSSKNPVKSSEKTDVITDQNSNNQLPDNNQIIVDEAGNIINGDEADDLTNVINVLKNKIISDASGIGTEIPSIEKIIVINKIDYVSPELETISGQMDLQVISGETTYNVSYDISDISQGLDNSTDINLISSFVCYLQLCGIRSVETMSDEQLALVEKLKENDTSVFYISPYNLYMSKIGMFYYNFDVYSLLDGEIKITTYRASKNAVDNLELSPYEALLQDLEKLDTERIFAKADKTNPAQLKDITNVVNSVSLNNTTNNIKLSVQTKKTKHELSLKSLNNFASEKQGIKKDHIYKM